MAEFPDQMIARLRKEQEHWESVEREAADVLEKQRDAEARRQAEKLRDAAMMNLDEITKEIHRIDQLKAEQQKADAFEKDRRDRQHFDKQDIERLEAIVKESNQKLEAFEKQKAKEDEFAKAAREQQEAFQREENSKTMAGAVHIGAQVIDLGMDVKDIVEGIVPTGVFSEMKYIKDQAIEAFAEAGNEIGIAIANPVAQKEVGNYLEERKEGLKDFIADEMFQAASAETKKKWLEHKFVEVARAEEEKFGDRKDDWHARENLKDGIAELRETLLDAAKKELEIEKKLKADLEPLKKAEATALARLGGDDDKMAQVHENAKKLEEQLRQKAEGERQAVWEKAQQEMEKIEARKREEAAREEAERRRQADRDMKDKFHFR